MAERKLRLSHQALRVIGTFVEEPRKSFSGSDLADKLAIGSGTLYPILGRFEDAGWLDSTWEEVDPSEAKRPRKRLYRITAVGQNSARSALREVQFPGAAAWNT